jgi:hypothetical protein
MAGATTSGFSPTGSRENPTIHSELIQAIDTASQAVLTRQEFEIAVAKLIADVPTLTDLRIEAELFRLVASLGDAHTALAGSRRRIEFAMTMPLGFYAFDDGLFVISAAPQYRESVGAKVILLDDMPTEIALRKIDALISHDNAMWLRTMEPHFLRHVPLLKELGIVHDDAAVEHMETVFPPTLTLARKQ